jgi:TetR/AcrR family transcriptional repressor of uid operon
MAARPVNKKLRNERRHQIMLAAAEVFRANGFHGASMEELCAAADMSPGTLYNYFSGKDAIIKALVEAELEHYVAVVESLMGSPEALKRLLSGDANAVEQAIQPHESYVGAECWLEIMRNDSLGALALVLDDKLRRTVAKAIQKAQKQGLLDASLAPRATANVLVALLSGISFDAETIPGYDLAGSLKAAMVLLQRYLSPASSSGQRA